MDRLRLDYGPLSPFDSVPPLVTISRRGFRREFETLRGRIRENPRLISKLFVDGRLVDVCDDGRSIPGSTSFIRILLETSTGPLRVDLSRHFGRKVLNLERELAAQGRTLRDHDVEFHVVDDGERFDIQVRLATDEAQPAPMKDCAT
jgi:hypothetical protein